MKEILDQREREYLSPLACHSDQGIRRYSTPREKASYRQAFSLDADRILNSLAYTRYIDKTQVFSLFNNDHLTHRVLHVQLVSRIARTIGRYLGLNEDLIEAISMGHDLGHSPFGHEGERILSSLTREFQAGYFHHNLQSVRFLEHLERKGKGWNLTLQTLDGILCHNGEIHLKEIRPSRKKSFENFDRTSAQMIFQSRPDPIPMTMEGCVVRLSDTISYIGRDMEDAIRINLIRRRELPDSTTRVLGNTNGTIVFNLVTDLIGCSVRQPFLSFSSETADAMNDLRQFNYERIYRNPAIKRHLKPVREIYRYLFETYLEELEKEAPSPDLKKFIGGLSSYQEKTTPAEIVRDYISGMTDSFFIRQAPESMRPANSF